MMLLSGYRNPPFRPPARASPHSNHNDSITNNNILHSQRQLTPPLGSQSPKRKHPDDVDELLAGSGLRIETTSTMHDVVREEASGADSPRTKVAERFRDLNVSSNLLRGESPRKKVRTSLSEDDCGTPRRDEDDGLLEVPESAQTGVRMIDDEDDELMRSSPTPQQTERGHRELRQTLDLGRMIPHSPAVIVRQPHSNKTDNASILPNNNISENDRTSPSTSPPTSAMSLDPSTNSSKVAFTQAFDPATFTPSISSSAITEPDRASLTWSMDEITGHDIDTSTPDDDGEGINGIGFRPTPAMAYARSLKRRQQVNEWKAREAREARQKRIEKRRGKGSVLDAGGGGGDSTKRIVRFAEVGM